jgi:hypothetical protein
MTCFTNYQMYDIPIDTTLYACGTNHRHLIQPYHNHRCWIQTILVIVVGYKYPSQQLMNVCTYDSIMHTFTQQIIIINIVSHSKFLSYTCSKKKTVSVLYSILFHPIISSVF